jgi:hypothetical protein
MLKGFGKLLDNDIGWVVENEAISQLQTKQN